MLPVWKSGFTTTRSILGFQTLRCRVVTQPRHQHHLPPLLQHHQLHCEVPSDLTSTRPGLSTAYAPSSWDTLPSTATREDLTANHHHSRTMKRYDTKSISYMIIPHTSMLAPISKCYCPHCGLTDSCGNGEWTRSLEPQFLPPTSPIHLLLERACCTTPTRIITQTVFDM
jgi:hypothetical protein